MESINHAAIINPGQSIFLLGFMGTGKSTWVKKWAGLYNMPFLDLDELIEQATGSTVVGIFEKEGEDFFREKETEILKSQCNVQGHIISCGGGTPCFYENMNWMNENGFTVYLSATAPFILKNVLEDKEKRPLVKNINEAELLFFVEQKLKERMPFYNMAKLSLDAENLNINSLGAMLAPTQ